MKDGTCLNVELNDAQIWLLITTCNEKKQDLEVVLKNSDGLEQETIQELQLRVRDLTDVIRELQFYSIVKSLNNFIVTTLDSKEQLILQYALIAFKREIENDRRQRVNMERQNIFETDIEILFRKVKYDTK